ncbi:formylglycine-generating enzyme family protein [Arcicella rigui]|uniref:SUMF1/EgtB/PvdO family nonheme iron enzyme n=1 Tax=Arcicella rigui TaxID=797020 RepID=A0ABU5Q7K0_9BACT|nr:SUMF1/EgtB/PvdO family nonheme iron enzyme [Arcicella rigui]MEA5138568.1 SUMF1/EgtB/PvdO family nonheme iron enzyme [Arcicella rigui]
MSKRNYICLILAFLGTACSLELPVVTSKSIKQCTFPSNIIVTNPESSNLSKIALSIGGSSSDVSNVAWKISENGSEIFSSSELSPTTTLSKDGTYSINCKITTSCGTSTDLSTKSYIVSSCIKPTGILATSSSSTPLDLDLAIDGNLQDIVSVVWLISKDGTEIYKSDIQRNSPFSIKSPTLTTDGSLIVKAQITNKCNLTYDLQNQYTYNIPTKLVIPTIFVEGGAFNMGGTDPDTLFIELPVHNVILSDFYIGKYEITQSQWFAVMGSNPSYFSKFCDNCPVEQVSWDDAQEFLSKLNKLTGKSYRLPTEAEWEFAARGGNKSKGYLYSGSNDINKVAWYTINSDNQIHEVGLLSGNELGINDMTGNVNEWCFDWYSSDYYKISPINNPINKSVDVYKVYRGGGWNWEPKFSRNSNRAAIEPTVRYYNIGFRVAYSK